MKTYLLPLERCEIALDFEKTIYKNEDEKTIFYNGEFVFMFCVKPNFEHIKCC